MMMANNFIRAINGTRAVWHVPNSLQASLTRIDISHPTSPNDETRNSSHGNTETIDSFCTLKTLKLNNINRLLIGCININSIKEKFDSFKTLVMGNIDIVVVNESKIDTSFSSNNLSLMGTTCNTDGIEMLLGLGL